MRFMMVIVVLCSPLISTAQETVEIPFRLIDGWAIVLEGSLGGLSNQQIMVDTGAVPSAVNKKVARRLGLSGSIDTLSLVNRTIKVEKVRVQGVRLGPVAVDNLDMVTVDLGTIEQALNIRIDAVIGLDLLGKQNFVIDYHRKKLIFGSVVDATGGIAVQMKQVDGGTYLLVPIETGGEILQMLLDTGTKDITLFRPQLRGRLQQLRAKGHEPTINTGGSDRVVYVEMPTVTAGPLSRKRQKAYILNMPESEIRDFDGLLGPTALGATAIVFDFDHHLVVFRSSSLASLDKTDLGSSTIAYAVIGATADQESSLRSQIQVMQPEVLPLRILFVPHWKYLDAARTFRLHVPTGFASVMFTHLPSRTIFIDNDRYSDEDWLGH